MKHRPPEDFEPRPENFRFSIRCDCHGCGRNEDSAVVKAEWLTPYFVRLSADSDLQTQLCPTCAKWKPIYWIKVVWKLRIGRLSSFLKPGYGCCDRCRTNWYFVEGHSTDVPETGSGMFPLCEQCWSELTPAERLPHYRRVFDSWGDHKPFTLDQLERAVLAGG